MRPAAPGRAGTRLLVVLLIAFVLHAAFDGSLIIGSARPSLSLTTLLVCCLFVNVETGALLGFVAGVLEASYASHYIGSHIVTRTLAGFLVGMLEERVFRDSLFVAVPVTFIGTLFVDLAFFAFAPQSRALLWFTNSFQHAVYNGLLAIPIYFLVRRVVRGRPH